MVIMKNKLNLPIITDNLPEPKHLSMNEYLKFLELNLNYTSDRNPENEHNKRMIVPVPFKLYE